MGGRLEGKIVIITGGTSGIGEATAELFSSQGAWVTIAGRSEEKGAAIAERLGDTVIYQRADVTREEDIKALVDKTIERFGRLDCMFNNAGGPDRGALDDVTMEDFDYSMRLLLGSVVMGIKYAAAVMKPEKSGVIINNSSIAAHRTNQGGYLYSAAKAGVVQLTKLAGLQLGPYNIRVNSIAPGAIATPIFWGGSEIANTLEEEKNQRKMEKLQRSLANATPLPRSGLAMDIANAALFLASDEGSFVNCHDLVVDGGRIAMFNEKPPQT